MTKKNNKKEKSSAFNNNRHERLQEELVGGISEVSKVLSECTANKEENEIDETTTKVQSCNVEDIPMSTLDNAVQTYAKSDESHHVNNNSSMSNEQRAEENNCKSEYEGENHSLQSQNTRSYCSEGKYGDCPSDFEELVEWMKKTNERLKEAYSE